ncbi:outer membrane beta-barrel protein [Sphingobacterium hungaricum]|uniref:Outer membrane protein beta-barrel domain-containing protein n=1 Tax=Sphingobacterium hungaricum TaxID=2082723 RepID=A0A928V1D0_9SPHI|nr:outer membrane beta-barrel protein [Sphingobacterium hungaricum]MBE8714864.1 hypothetical protein [Sphingobacterium hungaricum]
MEDKNKRDSIDEMIDLLKAADEVPYREGAWEKFQKTYPTAKKNHSLAYWSAVAALLLLFGLGYVYQKNRLPQETNLITQTQTDSENEVNPNVENNVAVTPESNQLSPMTAADETEHISSLESSPSRPATVNNQLIPLEREEFSALALNTKPTYTLNLADQGYYRTTVSRKNQDIALKSDVVTPEHLAHNNFMTQVEFNEVDNRPTTKKFMLSNRFELGAFVSPASTENRVKVGGGLIVAYNLSNKLSFRTGIAYNEYEVGILQDPTQSSSTEIVPASNVQGRSSSYSLVGTNNAVAASSYVVLPNVSAITGKVQSLDIPFELTYKVAKNFYATGGVSYAPILNQQRYAHYIDNVNTTTFTDGLPTNQAEVESAVKAVTKTTESSEENVSTNGFGGFVNFSVGRKVGLNKKFSVSVEPFVKLPVGNFRSPEMNYTNGGIKIITNF